MKTPICLGMCAILGLPLAAYAATSDYTIRLHERAAEVHAHFPEAPADEVTFRLHSWASYDYYDDIDGVIATDLAGKSLAVRNAGKGEWVVANGRKPFDLMWRVKPAKDSMVGTFGGSQFHATLLKDWAVMWGHAFVLMPEGPLADGPVTVDVEANQYKSWDSTLPPDGKLEHLRDLSEQLFVAGAFRTYRRDDRKYYFATSQPGVPDEDIMSAVDKILTAQTRYIGRVGVKAPILVFTDGRPDSSGGTVVRNSAVFYPNLTRGLMANNAGALKLVAHELFHLWNGTAIEHKFDAEWSDGKYGWFKEGFTDYYAGATLYREGILDDAAFATFVNRLITAYVQNPESLRATTEIMASQHWRDRDHQQLPYTKGALIGLLMDVQLRRKGKSLDDYMRAMLRHPGYGMEELRAEWLALMGADGRAFWDRYIPTAAALPSADIFRAAGIPFEEREIPIFQLGFMIDKPRFEKGVVVTGVIAGSNAEKAGLRVGDSLQGFSIYTDDFEKPAKLLVQRGDERTTVTYQPVTTAKAVVVGEKWDLLR